MTGRGGPVFSGVDGSVAIPIAGGHVGHRGEEEDGEGGESPVGGVVQGGAAAAVNIENGVGVGDENVSGGGGAVGADGPRENAFAASASEGG